MIAFKLANDEEPVSLVVVHFIVVGLQYIQDDPAILGGHLQERCYN